LADLEKLEGFPFGGHGDASKTPAFCESAKAAEAATSQTWPPWTIGTKVGLRSAADARGGGASLAERFVCFIKCSGCHLIATL
jgi:hypothetical protein